MTEIRSSTRRRIRKNLVDSFCEEYLPGANEELKYLLGLFVERLYLRMRKETKEKQYVAHRRLQKHFE